MNEKLLESFIIDMACSQMPQIRRVSPWEFWISACTSLSTRFSRSRLDCWEYEYCAVGSRDSKERRIVLKWLIFNNKLPIHRFDRNHRRDLLFLHWIPS